MDKNCEIVKDLIPLVADNIASEESKKFVTKVTIKDYSVGSEVRMVVI